MKSGSFRLAVAHAAVVSSLVLAVLLVLDDVNPRIGFMRCWLSLATAAVSVLSSLLLGVGEIVRSSREKGRTATRRGP